ncbi:MAG TPA: hypothetical protein VFW47_03180 [Phenylobacterium sp.]|nr:hypothetical protein [Phenylobacterium sp.]
MPVAEFSPPGDSVHVVLVSARHARAALLAIEDGLGAHPAELCGLTLRPVGAIVEGVLRVKGLDDQAAERLAARLSSGLGVHSVRLEHQWGLR